VQEQLASGGIDVLSTTIVERAAFRDMFDYGGGLADLDPAQVSNVEKARDNARAFAGEVLARLKAQSGQGRAVA
jgi:chromosome partitioning protein